MITQNALVVSDYYLIPIMMDDMGVQGVHHVQILLKRHLLEK